MADRSAGNSIFKHAVLNQYNLIAMGGSFLLSLASGSPLPALVAGAGELIWLVAGAPSPRFRKWVESRARQEEAQRWSSRVGRIAAGLDPNVAERLRLVGGALMEVNQSIEERGDPEIAATVGAKLEALLQTYANLATAHQRLVRLLAAGGAEAAEAEIARLNGALAEEKDSTVRISLRQATALAQRRFKRFEQLESMGRDLAVKVATFEGSLDFVRAEVAGGEPENEILRALDEMLGAARISPDHEAEVARTLGERRMVSAVFPVAGRTSDG
jgi:hypothetical protein